MKYCLDYRKCEPFMKELSNFDILRESLFSENNTVTVEDISFDPWIIVIEVENRPRDFPLLGVVWDVMEVGE